MSKPDAEGGPYEPTRVPGERPGPEGGTRHANRIARTRSLVESGVQCFLAHGLDAVTIDDVVRHAGTAKGTFYRYFEDKDDLVGAAFRPLGEAVLSSMARCVDALHGVTDADRLELAYGTLATDLLMLLVEHPDMVRLFLQERHGPRTGARAPILDLDAGIVEHAVRITKAGRASGLLAPVDPAVTAMAVVGAVHELLWRQFQGRDPATLFAEAQSLISLVLYGVRARR